MAACSGADTIRPEPKIEPTLTPGGAYDRGGNPEAPPITIDQLRITWAKEPAGCKTCGGYRFEATLHNASDQLWAGVMDASIVFPGQIGLINIELPWCDVPAIDVPPQASSHFTYVLEYFLGNQPPTFTQWTHNDCTRTFNDAALAAAIPDDAEAAGNITVILNGIAYDAQASNFDGVWDNGTGRVWSVTASADVQDVTPAPMP
jgi:hypothetical protein